jgi:hypothetical protein
MNASRGALSLPILGIMLLLAGPVQAAEPAYLAAMPSPAQVAAKTTGTDAFDTSAREDATFVVLIAIMGDMEGSRQFGDTTVAEKSLRSAYVQADKQIRGEPGVTSQRTKWYALEASYELDPAFTTQILTTFFDPAFRADYAKAHAAGAAAASAGAAAIDPSLAPASSSPATSPSFLSTWGALIIFVVIIVVGIVVKARSRIVYIWFR